MWYEVLRYLPPIMSGSNSQRQSRKLRFWRFLNRRLNLKFQITLTAINQLLSMLILRMKLYDKGYDLNFPIVNFSFICSNIPAVPPYGVSISQLIRYSRACGSYNDFLDRELLLTRKLLNQEFLVVKLKHYGRHHDLFNHYIISITHDLGYVPFVVITRREFPNPWHISGCVKIRATCWERTDYFSGAPRSSSPLLVGFVLFDL